MGPFNRQHSVLGLTCASCVQTRQSLGAVPASGSPLDKQPDLAPSWEWRPLKVVAFSHSHIGERRAGPWALCWALGAVLGMEGRAGRDRASAPGPAFRGPRRCPASTREGASERDAVTSGNKMTGRSVTGWVGGQH